MSIFDIVTFSPPTKNWTTSFIVAVKLTTTHESDGHVPQYIGTVKEIEIFFCKKSKNFLREILLFVLGRTLTMNCRDMPDSGTVSDAY